MQAWQSYDVKFKGTRLMLAPDDDPGTLAFLRDYLDSCDLVAMPRLPIPNVLRRMPAFCCTLAMKHLVGIRVAALRPDRLWRVTLAAGGKPYEPGVSEGPAVALKYDDASGQHGFVDSDGTITPIDVVGATNGAYVTGVDAAGYYYCQRPVYAATYRVQAPGSVQGLR